MRIGEWGNYVPGLTTVEVDCIQNVLTLMTIAERNRSQASTNMNEHSSRSHMMLTVSMSSQNRLTGIATRGKLNLVSSFHFFISFQFIYNFIKLILPLILSN